ncbi:MAG: hypothetical protein L0220_27115 [Acidobacteria bacterium]|nr:hypothetical protein [Acidobacteriota bacterium]
MKIKTRTIFVATLLLAVPFSIHAASSERKAKRLVRAQIKQSELQELLRRIEQAEAEARRARRESEELRKRLEENTDELARMRRTIADFSVAMADTRADRIETSLAVAPALKPQAIEPELSGAVDRIERLEEQVEINSTQIKEHAQSKVESDSRLRVKLYGMLLANSYFNSNDSSLRDVPQHAPPPGLNARKNNFGATLRQTRIGLAMEGPRLSSGLGNARLSAQAEFDFWGEAGQFGGDMLGLLRLLTATARLDWERTSLVVGQRQPLISPLNPHSLAAVWLPPLSGSGNLSQWRPQIALERRIKGSESSQLIIQGGLMMPFGETLQGRTIEGGPGYQTRIALRRNLDEERRLEVGFGGYLHRRPFPFDRRVSSFAITSDWSIPLGSRLELKGETYFGRAIGLSVESGGSNDTLYAVTGQIDQTGTGIRGILSAGGWTELGLRARPDLDFNFAYGQNDPRNSDIPAGFRTPFTRFKNQNASANFIWQLRHNYLLSVEYRRMWTKYSLGQQTNNHINLAVGYSF